jgi:hypothetical protein
MTAAGLPATVLCVKLRALAITTAVLMIASACGSSSDNASGKSTDTGGVVSEDWTMARAAPAFAAHFTDPIYEEVSDDTTPFGSDEGADMLAIWDERRDELGPHSTVADVLEGDPQEYLSSNTFDDAMAVQAAGFTLLRLTGHIDAEGKQATLAALDQLMSTDMFGENPSMIRQRDDLRSWSE